MKRFLIGQLASFGDCVYATTVAKQIKNDYPGCHITWAVASKYKSILELNPHIDEVWEIPLVNNDYYNVGWTNFEQEAEKRKREGVYDELIFTQLAKQHWQRYDGTIRSSTLSGYKKPITVPVDPVIRLSEKEIANVAGFANSSNLKRFREVILFEYSPGSGQSFVTEDIALQIVSNIVSLHKDVCFVMSGPKKWSNTDLQIIDASELTFRENAELTKYCSLLVGCSSGITWLSTSDWAKKLKTVQLLNKEYQFFAGVKYDLEYWKISTEGVIEITLNDVNHITKCLNGILDNDFKATKEVFDELYRPEYFNFRNVMVIVMAMTNNKVGPMISLIRHFSLRNKHFKLNRLLYYYLKEAGNIQRSRVNNFFRRFIHRFN
jgi:hypothetical protein